jgi:hypothetical protein
MTKLRFSKSEVISFLEDLIKSGAANEEQEELYINYTWNGVLVKNYTYKKVLRLMKKEYNGK